MGARPDTSARPGSFASEADGILDDLTAHGEGGAPWLAPTAPLPSLVARADRLDGVVLEMLQRSAARAADVERRLHADVEAAYLHGFAHAFAEVAGVLRGLDGPAVMELLRVELADARRRLPAPEEGADLTACRRASQAIAAAAIEPSPF